MGAILRGYAQFGSFSDSAIAANRPASIGGRVLSGETKRQARRARGALTQVRGDAAAAPPDWSVPAPHARQVSLADERESGLLQRVARRATSAVVRYRYPTTLRTEYRSPGPSRTPLGPQNPRARSRATPGQTSPVLGNPAPRRSAS